MKRLVLAILIFSAISSITDAKYSGGSGEPNDPYQIANVAGKSSQCRSETEIPIRRGIGIACANAIPLGMAKSITSGSVLGNLAILKSFATLRSSDFATKHESIKSPDFDVKRRFRSVGVSGFLFPRYGVPGFNKK